MVYDKRIEWCRDNIPGFKAMHDQAEKSRIETEANRQRFANATVIADTRGSARAAESSPS